MPPIALACDHAGYQLKEAIKLYLDSRNIPYKDFGCDSEARCDYPDYAAEVARAVQQGDFQQGILTCGSGIGMAIAANRFPGVRALVATEPFSVEMSRRHNDANVLCMGGRVIAAPMAETLIQVFLETAFEAGRHRERTQKMDTVYQGEQIQC